MEEDMPPVGLPKNLTHLSDSLSSCSFRWLGRGLQVLEGRETRQLASSSSGVESRHLRGLGTSASLLLLLSPQRPQSLFFNRLEPSSLILLPSKSTPILEDLRIKTLSLDLMILATMWPSLATMVCLSLMGTSMRLPLTLTMTCSPSGFMVISVLPMKTLTSFLVSGSSCQRTQGSEQEHHRTLPWSSHQREDGSSHPYQPWLCGCQRWRCACLPRCT